jgi:iron(III) transport system substrate-binding protein
LSCRAARRWALAGILLTACGGDARTPVVVYSPHGRDLLSALERAYEAAHPEIDVRWLDMGSQEVYDRVRSEKANPQCDVWFGGPDSIFARGADEGLLAAFRPSWADTVPADSRGPNDLYFGVYRTLPVLLYNSAALKEDAAPADWDALLEPRFTGKVLIRDPLASGTLRTVWGMVLARSVAETGDEARGWAWLRRLDSQTKEYTANSALLFEKLKRQEGLVSIWELSDVLLARQQGAPFGFRLASSGTPVINDAIGLVTGARHVDAARAYIEWVGGREAQELAAREAYKLPARSDFAPADLPEWTRPVLASLRSAEYDRALAARETPRWMSEWDRGVRGRGAQ